MQSTMEYGVWSMLPRNCIERIAMHIPGLDDLLKFGAVAPSRCDRGSLSRSLALLVSLCADLSLSLSLGLSLSLSLSRALSVALGLSLARAVALGLSLARSGALSLSADSNRCHSVVAARLRSRRSARDREGAVLDLFPPKGTDLDLSGESYDGIDLPRLRNRR